MDIDIDFNLGVASFLVNMESSTTKETYKGPFKVKCILSPIEYIKADAMYRDFLGKTNPQFANAYVSQLSYALSQLKFRIIESPAWFQNTENNISGSFVDDIILLHVFERAVECEEEYRKGIKERYDNARKKVQEALEKQKTEKETENTEDIDEEDIDQDE
jgi:hypothetical protein